MAHAPRRKRADQVVSVRVRDKKNTGHGNLIIMLAISARGTNKRKTLARDSAAVLVRTEVQARRGSKDKRQRQTEKENKAPADITNVSFWGLEKKRRKAVA